MMAPVEDDGAKTAQGRVIEGAGHVTVAVAVEGDRLLHRRLSSEEACGRGHQGSPIGLAPEVDRGPAAGSAGPATDRRLGEMIARDHHRRSHGAKLFLGEDREMSEITQGVDAALVETHLRQPLVPEWNLGPHESDLAPHRLNQKRGPDLRSNAVE